MFSILLIVPCCAFVKLSVTSALIKTSTNLTPDKFIVWLVVTGDDEEREYQRSKAVREELQSQKEEKKNAGVRYAAGADVRMPKYIIFIFYILLSEDAITAASGDIGPPIDQP